MRYWPKDHPVNGICHADDKSTMPAAALGPFLYHLERVKIVSLEKTEYKSTLQNKKNIWDMQIRYGEKRQSQNFFSSHNGYYLSSWFSFNPQDWLCWSTITLCWCSVSRDPYYIRFMCSEHPSLAKNVILTLYVMIKSDYNCTSRYCSAVLACGLVASLGSN